MVSDTNELASVSSTWVVYCILFLLGEPFKVSYWLAQCTIVLLVMLIMKLIIGPMVVFRFWKKVIKSCLNAVIHNILSLF